MRRTTVLSGLALAAVVSAVAVGRLFNRLGGPCFEGPHPGIAPSDHHPIWSVWPPSWRCQYELLAGGRVLGDSDVSSTVICLLVAVAVAIALTRAWPRLSLVLQGVIHSWLMLVACGIAIDPYLDWLFVFPLLYLPIAGVLQHVLNRRLDGPRNLGFTEAVAVGGVVWFFVCAGAVFGENLAMLVGVLAGTAAGVLVARLLSHSRVQPWLRRVEAALTGSTPAC